MDTFLPGVSLGWDRPHGPGPCRRTRAPFPGLTVTLPCLRASLRAGPCSHFSSHLAWGSRGRLVFGWLLRVRVCVRSSSACPRGLRKSSPFPYLAVQVSSMRCVCWKYGPLRKSLPSDYRRGVERSEVGPTSWGRPLLRGVSGSEGLGSSARAVLLPLENRSAC